MAQMVAAMEKRSGRLVRVTEPATLREAVGGSLFQIASIRPEGFPGGCGTSGSQWTTGCRAKRRWVQEVSPWQCARLQRSLTTSGEWRN